MIQQKGSAYLECVNARLYSMIESGLIDSWISNLVANASNCDTKAKILSSHDRGLVQLSLSEVERFFLIFMIGLITSVCGFLAEMAKAKMDRNRDSYLNKIGNIRKRRMRVAMLKMMKEVKTNSAKIQKIRDN